MAKQSLYQGHPCFDKLAHFRVGRLHLPVAPKCNIKCKYCHRAVGSSEDRPGVCTRIISPAEALIRTRRVLANNESIKIIGVAGPGEALANEATFATLALIQQEFPELRKCISTNGLLLESRLDDLIKVGVSSISVTVNAVDERIGRYFYDHIFMDGKLYRQDFFKILSVNQLRGVRLAVKKGIAVKVNSVLVPTLNGGHLTEVAKRVAALGAGLMNIMPLKPISSMSVYTPPTCAELDSTRSKCEKFIPQFKLCRQCRADAVGIPGKGEQSWLGSIPLFH